MDWEKPKGTKGSHMVDIFRIAHAYIWAVCRHYDITKETFIHAYGGKDAIAARRVYVAYARGHRRWSFPQIAETMGHRSWTNAHRCWQQWKADPDWKAYWSIMPKVIEVDRRERMRGRQ